MVHSAIHANLAYPFAVVFVISVIRPLSELQSNLVICHLSNLFGLKTKSDFFQVAHCCSFVTFIYIFFCVLSFWHKTLLLVLLVMHLRVI